MSTCPVCLRPAKALVSSINRGVLMSTRCTKCASSFVPTADFAAKYKRDRMRENHRADLVQRYDGDKPSKEYARLYPEQARRQFGDKFMETI